MPHRLSCSSRTDTTIRISPYLISVLSHCVALSCMITISCMLAGCGGSSQENKVTGTISGKITIKGKALASGQVNYFSEETGAGALGTLKEDGTYEIDGEIPVGIYRVYLSPVIDLDATPPPGHAHVETKLKGVPKKYQSEAKTDLTATVKEGQNTLDFDLKS